MEMAMDFYLLSTHNICCRPLPFFSTFGVNHLVQISRKCLWKICKSCSELSGFFGKCHFFHFGAYHLVLVLCLYTVSYAIHIITCDSMTLTKPLQKISKLLGQKTFCIYQVSVSVTEMSRHQFRLIISLFLLASTLLLSPEFKICLVCNLWQHRICIILTR